MTAMPSPRRSTWVLLLLAVLASHASLTLHFNSHLAADQPNCELCTHYSHFEHATPPPAIVSFGPAVHILEPLAPAAVPAAAESAPYHPRAPPPAA
jgi:hypothetical protein